MSDINKTIKSKATQSGSPESIEAIPSITGTIPTKDPLYSIFEQHLYNFQDSDVDRKTFIAQVVQAYLTYLRKLKIAVPKHYEPYIAEELSIQVNTMLVKKIYGCLSIDEYRKTPKPRKLSRFRTGSK